MRIKYIIWQWNNLRQPETHAPRPGDRLPDLLPASNDALHQEVSEFRRDRPLRLRRLPEEERWCAEEELRRDRPCRIQRFLETWPPNPTSPVLNYPPTQPPYTRQNKPNFQSLGPTSAKMLSGDPLTDVSHDMS